MWTPRDLKEGVARLIGRPRRDDFLRLLPKHSIGAEIGVFRGHYTDHILRIAQPRELHLIDGWWLVYGEHFPDWGAYTDHGRLSTRAAYNEVRRIVSRRRAEDKVRIHVADDLACLEAFPERSFDWVYLDSSHQYEHTREELLLLLPRMRGGGVIGGDDWQDDPAHSHHGVAKAVGEFCARHGWSLQHRDAFGQWLIKP
jgi:hypothetical protein